MRNIHDWFSTGDNRLTIQHIPAPLDNGDIFIGPDNCIYIYDNGGGKFNKLIIDNRRSSRVAASPIIDGDSNDSRNSGTAPHVGGYIGAGRFIASDGTEWRKHHLPDYWVDLGRNLVRHRSKQPWPNNVRPPTQAIMDQVDNGKSTLS